MMDTLTEISIKKRSAAVYDWLQLLSLVSVPWFLYSVITLSNRASMLERFWTAATPATPYLVVLLWIGGTAQAIFIKRHVRQGLALVGLRALTAAIASNLNSEPSEGLWFFFLANGFLWFFGSSTGKRQVNEGVGMVVRQAERLSLQSIRDLEQSLTEVAKRSVPVSVPEAIAPALFARGEALAAEGKSREAVQDFIAAFRTGDFRIRAQVARRLEKMGMVEEF